MCDCNMLLEEEKTATYMVFCFCEIKQDMYNFNDKIISNNICVCMCVCVCTQKKSRGVHSIVKLNTTCDKKIIYFLNKLSPKYVIFY
jgi:hypothetical protein